MDEVRIKRFRQIHFNRWNLIEEYEKIETLHVLEKLVVNDCDCLSEIMKTEDANRCSLLFNFVYNFKWFLLFSDHNTVPAGLIEDDVDGMSFYDAMKRIYSKVSDD